ncbi:50S ribosomal protein L10 [Candidatus Woesearchaeota archaeon]|nr:50S ribosomal protein L10 [Candidatus Woesearchaeota archaeon]
MVSESKQQIVREIITKVKEYPIVGVVNMQSLPAQQLQVMRNTLRKKGVEIVMTRKRLLIKALQDSQKQNIEQLVQTVKGMPALIMTKENPFSLYATLQKNKSEAPAKAGQTAPRNIVVKAGPTSFAPGPIISELAAVGIKTKVDAGKLTILSDVTVAKEGDTISSKLAETLKRLDIKPMEIGLDLVAVWESGMVFAAKQLHIDEAEFMRQIIEAAQWATNLAVETAYPAADVIEVLVQKAFRDAKAVGVEAAFMTEETKDALLAQAEAEALAVQKEAGL